MYCPAHFAETRIEEMHALMRTHPLATMVTLGSDGLAADHVPFVLSPADGPYGTLRGHVARANPVWRSFLPESGIAGNEVLCIFRGPASYITPNWYPGKREHGKAVPTWNYAVVEARGKLRVVEDRDWLLRQVDALTQQQEATFAEPWSVSDAPADYLEKMLAAIVGIELEITALAGKWKTSQNQPSANRAGAAAGLRALGSDEAMASAALIER